MEFIHHISALYFLWTVMVQDYSHIVCNQSSRIICAVIWYIYKVNVMADKLFSGAIFDWIIFLLQDIYFLPRHCNKSFNAILQCRMALKKRFSDISVILCYWSLQWFFPIYSLKTFNALILKVWLIALSEYNSSFMVELKETF